MRFGVVLGVAALVASAAPSAFAQPRIYQQPSISRDLIAFGYAGDIWTVPRAGGNATRVTTGTGVEMGPVFSPDGGMIAFTGEYEGNQDVFTVPATGGVPKRITFHPSADVAVGWSSDGREVLFRSARTAASRYTQIFRVSTSGGLATPLPLPMAHAGVVSADGKQIAYNPLAPAFLFNFGNYVSWGNYRGGLASTIRVTTLNGLGSVEVPHEISADLSPAWAGGKLYFLSGRSGPISVYSFDPATKKVSEVYKNTGSDIRSLTSDGQTLAFDRLGEIYTLSPGGQPKLVPINATGDMPDVRPRVLNVSDQVRSVSVSPTGVRAVVEAHGEILTAPLKKGPVRNLTNTPGVMERTPAWSPDGESIAYFSDESGLYALHIVPQTGGAAKKISLGNQQAYYFDPLWSPDSKKIAFRDNRLRTYVLDIATGMLGDAGEPNVFGGFSDETFAMAWSPDSKWLAWTRSLANHMHGIVLYSADSGKAMQVTDGMGDARYPAFDRNGKYLYFLASNNAGAIVHGLDMTTDLYRPTRSIYALALTQDTASPVEPESDDEKSLAETQKDVKENTDATPAGKTAKAKTDAKDKPDTAAKPPAVKPVAIDLAGKDMVAITARTVALPVPPGAYSDLATGKPGVIFWLTDPGANDPGATGPDATLNQFTLEDRKVEKVAEHVVGYEVTADGEKLLLGSRTPRAPDAPPGPPGRTRYSIVPAKAGAPAKPEDTSLSLDGLEVRVDPAAEWSQMYKEVWRIQRAYFYDPNFHGFDTVAAEKKLAPYAAAVQSRSDLNYVFQEMLTGFSVGHLRGSGGAIPAAPRVPGGLLGADYVIRNNQWCVSKVYTSGSWSPDVKAPLAQPGLNVKAGDCILAINGAPLSGSTDIQQPLEGTAGKLITLKMSGPNGALTGARDISVVPVDSEQRLRNLDWIETNRKKVDELSGGKLAYVYLPDTGNGGFTAFNRYYFAQTDKQGVVVDERFNGGGQMADYIIEVLGRGLQSYWSPRYGAIDRTPAASILGPKVMIANEVSGSGGDALPWLFKSNKLGPLVGKRTWGGLVGIGGVPQLMDGAQVTSPSVGFFTPGGQWEVENNGVAPDVVVDQDPKAVADGHDPQLEAAVKIALDLLKSNGPREPKRPIYPKYPLTGTSK
jgi:tricorn protease